MDKISYERDKDGCFLITYKGMVIEAIEPSLHPVIAMRMVALAIKVAKMVEWEGPKGR